MTAPHENNDSSSNGHYHQLQPSKEDVESTSTVAHAMSLNTRIGLLVFGILQNALTGGVIFGWASIDH
eukprot:CAMPEP_0119565482 /NCGR_PEP_ID=MMETSP1352-20130426/30188_1 /TAXON_ID=265584 /ORGANISM="Stauroneis constricta, Strain CCMP1120" /LENGTH=67 /DNA_ID=CAMNT_0007614405 /DNA_START=54 /DNA_END=254 /DNA_ORIENTATION=-